MIPSKNLRESTFLLAQIDNRLLKVVAKEHSTDLNAAIDDVLSDILPYMSKMSNSPVTPPGNQGLLGRTDGGGEAFYSFG